MFRFSKNKNDNNEEEVEFQSKKIMDDLTDIYQNGDIDYTDDMGKLNKSSKSAIARFFTMFFSCSFLAIIIIMIGWVIFSRNQADPSGVGEKNVSLSIECNNAVSSIGEVICKIECKNQDKATLTDLELIVDYPIGFDFKSSSIEPADEKNDKIFNLSDISPLGKREIEIKGMLFGEKNSVKKLYASLFYKQDNSSLNFKIDDIETSIEVSAEVATVDIIGPKQILPNRDSEYIIKVKNNSKEGIENLRLTILYPNSFSPKEFSADPEGNDKNRYWWNIANLTATGEIEMKIIGVFSKDTRDDQEFNATLDVSNKQIYNLIAEDSFVSNAVEENVKLDLILNGSTNGKAVSFGDNLGYSLVYENYGEQDLKDVYIKMRIKGYQGDKEIGLINWESLKDENNGYIKDGEILWTNEEILKLSSFSAGEEGEIDFWLRLNDVSDVVSEIDSNGGDLIIKSVAEIVVGKVEDVDVEMIIESNKIVCDLNTSLIFNSQARYFNDDNIAVGSGPVPPKIGEETKYRIFWSIANSLHNTKEVSVKTVLPHNVEWTDRINADMGDLKYNKNSREIIWTISELPIKIKEASADFEISITPTEDDFNKILILTNETFLTAIDAKTDSQISAKSKSLTSDLEFDPIIGGKGVVE